jgi:hypothetical protein
MYLGVIPVRSRFRPAAIGSRSQDLISESRQQSWLPSSRER